MEIRLTLLNSLGKFTKDFIRRLEASLLLLLTEAVLYRGVNDRLGTKEVRNGVLVFGGKHHKYFFFENAVKITFYFDNAMKEQALCRLNS